MSFQQKSENCTWTSWKSRDLCGVAATEKASLKFQLNYWNTYAYYTYTDVHMYVWMYACIYMRVLWVECVCVCVHVEGHVHVRVRRLAKCFGAWLCCDVTRTASADTLKYVNVSVRYTLRDVVGADVVSVLATIWDFCNLMSFYVTLVGMSEVIGGLEFRRPFAVACAP